ncbi:MAG: FtsQ-type POTRA domain-containing protein [Clostridia bacterium]|nr:FtsQ-type POTRA domain-containing protein [Clostridia bacterium]
MRRKKKGKFWLPAVFIVFFGILVLCLMIVMYLFKIRSMNVIGNRTVPKEEIIDLSGVKPGDNYLFISEQKMKNRIETNRYLEYLSSQFDYSGALTISLNERHAMGILQLNGYHYVIDEHGMILENTGMTYPEELNCPIIKGLNMPDTNMILAGEVVNVKDREQLVALSKVLEALDETNMMGRTASVDMANLDNIYIMTTEKAKIVLGEAENLELKLLVAKEILHQRQDEDNLTGASIDISNGREAHYIPAVLPTPTPTASPTPTVAPSPTPERKR